MQEAQPNGCASHMFLLIYTPGFNDTRSSPVWDWEKPCLNELSNCRRTGFLFLL